MLSRMVGVLRAHGSRACMLSRIFTSSWFQSRLWAAASSSCVSAARTLASNKRGPFSGCKGKSLWSCCLRWTSCLRSLKHSLLCIPPPHPTHPHPPHTSPHPIVINAFANCLAPCHSIAGRRATMASQLWDCPPAWQPLARCPSSQQRAAAAAAAAASGAAPAGGMSRTPGRRAAAARRGPPRAARARPPPRWSSATASRGGGGAGWRALCAS